MSGLATLACLTKLCIYLCVSHDRSWRCYGISKRIQVRIKRQRFLRYWLSLCFVKRTFYVAHYCFLPASKATKHVTHYGSSGWTNAAFMNYGKTHHLENLEFLYFESIGYSCPKCIYVTKSFLININLTKCYVNDLCGNI